MPQTYFTKNPPKQERPPKRLKEMPTYQEIEGNGEFESIIERGLTLTMRRKSFKKPTGPAIVAGFDLDGTLVTTKSGYTYPRNGHDWKLLQGVATKLKQKLSEIPDEQLVFVIFTNQAGALPEAKSKSMNSVYTKLEGVGCHLRRIDFIYASLKIYDPELKAKYRKPGGGMFEMLEKTLGVPVDKQRSFFVGDAAGREGDHSADDKGFAKSAGLRFYTPEEYFETTKDRLHFKETDDTLDEETLEARPIESIFIHPDVRQSLHDQS